MPITRRKFAQGIAAGAALFSPNKAFAAEDGWTKEWDQAVLMSAVMRADAAYDPQETLLFHTIGPEYHYHTNLRNTRAHITRDSLDYAMNLLETGEPERKRRAERIINRMLDLQDTDPGSKWYGLWGYYMEEPASKMSPADWNWADFNGSTLLMMNARHGQELPSAMQKRVLEAIHHCAISVMRRNVAMSYTNIAVQGTFVTLAAAALLHDEELSRYAHDRILRFCATVDETGSFAEYNSPTYANVAIVNLVRMKMLLQDPKTIEIVDRLHERMWTHLGDHWHASTEQLAGPMSRCYSTDIGKPLWLQKSFKGAIRFTTLDEIRRGEVHESGEVSYLEYHCPDNVREKFLRTPGSHEHRELFLFMGKPPEPVEGTTYLAPTYTLGSANRSEFWVQRRPLLAYWGGNVRPARYLQMRFMKDDYDFSSALFFSVQSQSCVAYVVNFRSPGGDKHISLDPIENGEFQAQRLRVRLDLVQVPADSALLVDGKPEKLLEPPRVNTRDGVDIPGIGPRRPARKYRLNTRVAIDLGDALLGVHFHKARFGDEEPKLVLTHEEGILTVSLDLLNAFRTRKVFWAKTKDAFAAGTIMMTGTDRSLVEFDRHLAALACDCNEQNGKVNLTWNTPAGSMRITAGTAVQTVDEQNSSAAFSIDGRPVPEVRLSNEKIEPG
ncbi:MAG TPA: hypothetical protein VH325_01870 [Bryobacteraceae bacterium]|nr:hypothetical protein [Bryobacteraceae bacterium]